MELIENMQDVEADKMLPSGSPVVAINAAAELPRISMGALAGALWHHVVDPRMARLSRTWLRQYEADAAKQDAH